jgi:hypothetical protein
VEKVVESLHAVLFVSPKDGCVYWYHASFPDFVFSQTRAKISISVDQNYPTRPTHRIIDVFCDPPVHHGVVLTRRCFSIMQESLHFNMCNLLSSYVFDRHLVQAMPAKNDADDLICGLKDFLCNTLLFWIEAMNLIGTKSQCPPLLKDVESWAERRI